MTVFYSVVFCLDVIPTRTKLNVIIVSYKHYPILIRAMRPKNSPAENS